MAAGPLYLAAFLLALAIALVAAAVEVRSHRRVRPAPADQIRPVRYLVEWDVR
jgi:hypothetical protein